MFRSTVGSKFKSYATSLRTKLIMQLQIMFYLCASQVKIFSFVVWLGPALVVCSQLPKSWIATCPKIFKICRSQSSRSTRKNLPRLKGIPTFLKKSADCARRKKIDLRTNYPHKVYRFKFICFYVNPFSRFYPLF